MRSFLGTINYYTGHTNYPTETITVSNSNSPRTISVEGLTNYIGYGITPFPDNSFSVMSTYANATNNYLAYFFYDGTDLTCTPSTIISPSSNPNKNTVVTAFPPGGYAVITYQGGDSNNDKFFTKNGCSKKRCSHKCLFQKRFLPKTVCSQNSCSQNGFFQNGCTRFV